MRSRLQLLHERLTRTLPAPTFTTREGAEDAARAVERALVRYEQGDVAGAARELHGVDAVVVDRWEWDPIGHAYLDCMYALDNGHVEDAPLTPAEREAVLAADAAERETVLAADAARAGQGSEPSGTDRRRTPLSPRQRARIAGGCAVLIILGVVIVQAAFGPDYPKVTQRLSQVYGAEVEWRGNGKYQRDDLVLDGRNIGDHCVVNGEWFGLDDLRIDCDDPAYQPTRLK